MVIAPEYEVAALGVNVTVTVRDPPAKTVRLVGLTVNAAALLVIVETLSVAVPELLTVNVF